MVRFTTKKVASLTLGERMKKLRAEKRLSLVDISKSTKIQVKYLEFLEEGAYLKLPADVYVKGFLRSYALFMGLNEIALQKQYEREKGIHKNIKKIADTENSRKAIDFSSFVITPKTIVVSLVVILSLASFIYLYNEVNNFVSAPRLVVIKPSDGSEIEGNSTHVTGLAEKDALVFINDQPVLVNEKGEFSEDVGLKNGLNMIIVKARSKFNKEATVSVSVKADLPEVPLTQPTENTDQTQPVIAKGEFKAEVYVNPNPTWVSIEADGSLIYSGVLMPGASQSFNAKEKISVTTGKGSETFVKINDKDLGVVSTETGVVRGVVYDTNGKIKK